MTAARSPAARPRTPGSAHAHDSLVAAITGYLTLRKVPHFRVNQRPVLTKRGWRTPGADPGTPDMVACLALTGVTLLIECKTGGARLSPLQAHVRAQWEACGAWWVTARSVVDIEHVLKAWDDWFKYRVRR